MNWLKDLLGINRYVIAWRFARGGVKRSGTTRDYGMGHFTKAAAARVAREMNDSYGEGTHWAEVA